LREKGEKIDVGEKKFFIKKSFLRLKGLKHSFSRRYDKSGEFCCDFCVICCSFYHRRAQLVEQQFDYSHGPYVSEKSSVGFL